MIILQITDSLSSVPQTGNNGIASNVWFWTAIIEFLIILILIITSKRGKNKKWEKFQFMKGDDNIDVNFSSIIKDTFQAPEMYKKLMSICHPDRFLDEDKNRIAEELSKEIGENQYNLAELERLGKLAEEKLEIKIF